MMPAREPRYARRTQTRSAALSARLFKTHFACFAPNTIGHNKWKIYRSARHGDEITANSKDLAEKNKMKQITTCDPQIKNPEQ